MEPVKEDRNVTINEMEQVKEYKNVTFDEIKIGATAELTLTLTQNQIDLAAMVSGDVDAFYLMQPGDADTRQEARTTEASGAEAIISILLGTRLPGPGSKIRHRDLHFAGDFSVGDTLTAKVTAREKRKEGNLVVFDARCVDKAGQELVAGTVTVQAPTSRLVYDNIKPPQFELRWGDAFAQLIKGCQGCEPVPCAIVHPCDRDSLMGAIEAARRGFIIPVLVGPEDKIRAAAQEAQIDLGPYRIVPSAHSHESAEKAVALARTGEVEALMKGSLHTDEIMGAIVPTAAGLRTSRRISHAFVMDVATYPKMFVITDAAVNIFPDLEVKRDIVQNAIDLAHALGLAVPKVGILSAVEVINSKIPSTIDAAALCKMADRGQITGGILDGPLAFDNAISAQAAKTKGITSPVSGDVDILLAPDLEAANMLFKQLTYLSGAEGAGIVLGTRIPIVLTSRADSVRTRLASVAVMARVAHARRSGKYETK
ncbi:MAG TPA: bifunctional enoyl-CoA hydratase/phosphate acetyltransferase [Syntrophales bacterium]|nr:bifunctional enoyl-CoA hydratase/phosphate acetyltransferase [Syntrophales bacterium]